MKTIWKFSLIGILTFSGCANNTAPSSSVQVAKSQPTTNTVTSIHTPVVSKRLNDCIIRSNQSADALLVNSQIIAVSRNNSHAKALFNSPEKLTDIQAKTLEHYLSEANACRPIALEGISPEMKVVYEEFFRKIDGVYADLIARKITIGAANQERYLLIDDAHLKRLAIQFKKN